MNTLYPSLPLRAASTLRRNALLRLMTLQQLAALAWVLQQECQQW
jgi:hypothetical protein